MQGEGTQVVVAHVELLEHGVQVDELLHRGAGLRREATAAEYRGRGAPQVPLEGEQDARHAGGVAP